MVRFTDAEAKIALGMWHVPAHLLKTGKRVTCPEIALAIYKHRLAEKKRLKIRRRVTRPDKAAVWRLVNGLSHAGKQDKRKTKKRKRGPAPSLLPVTIRKIPKIIEKLEKEFPDDDVTAPMIAKELHMRIRTMNRSGRYPRQRLPKPRTVQKYIYKTGRKALRNRRKLPLTRANKRARARFGNHFPSKIEKMASKKASKNRCRKSIEN